MTAREKKCVRIVSKTKSTTNEYIEELPHQAPTERERDRTQEMKEKYASKTHPIKIGIPSMKHNCRRSADGSTQTFRLVCMEKLFDKVGNHHGKVIGYVDVSRQCFSIGLR